MRAYLLFCRLVLGFIATFLFYGAQAQVTKKFELTGSLTGFPDSAQVRLFRSGENMPFATTTLFNNQFTLRGELAEPLLLFLFVKHVHSRCLRVYLICLLYN